MPNSRVMLLFIVVAVLAALFLVYVVPLLKRFFSDWKKTYEKEDKILNPPEKEENKKKGK